MGPDGPFSSTFFPTSLAHMGMGLKKFGGSESIVRASVRLYMN